jgi:hypothetical protein
MPTTQIIQDADVELGTDAKTLTETIHALYDCAAACTACADACLAEDDPASMRRCITLDNVCADICTATAQALGRIASGSYEVLQAQLEACVVACHECAAECRDHAEMHQHCAACAEVCDRTEQAAKELLEAIS